MTESEPTPRRRFMLVDLVILVAASAVGMGIGRLSDSEALSDYLGDLLLIRNWVRASIWLSAAIVASSGAVLIARCVSPRPSFRQAIRQPGILACLLVLADWLATSSLHEAHNALSGLVKSHPFVPSFFGQMFMIHFTGKSVVVGWVTLAIVGEWRPALDWVDRAGRVVGVVTILLGLASMLCW